eukprot:SAG22_NODE_566_length_9044_cov_4.581107_3_plen_338_part_00
MEAAVVVSEPVVDVESEGLCPDAAGLVDEFMRGLNIGKYVPVLIKNGFDMEALSLCSKADLQGEPFYLSLGPAKKVLEHAGKFYERSKRAKRPDQPRPAARPQLQAITEEEEADEAPRPRSDQAAARPQVIAKDQEADETPWPESSDHTVQTAAPLEADRSAPPVGPIPHAAAAHVEPERQSASQSGSSAPPGGILVVYETPRAPPPRDEKFEAALEKLFEAGFKQPDAGEALTFAKNDPNEAVIVRQRPCLLLRLSSFSLPSLAVPRPFLWLTQSGPLPPAPDRRPERLPQKAEDTEAGRAVEAAAAHPDLTGGPGSAVGDRHGPGPGPGGPADVR